MTKQRLDKLVVERGLAETRTRAQALIIAGQVLVADQRADKPGHLVDPDSEIRIKGETPRYVSRGGLKLEAALREFNINVAGRTCIDIGASTGGFTDCLLQHEAAQVTAIDVGHNQLAWKIRSDPRVVTLEGVNARYLTPEHFPQTFDLATVNVSFISLTKILPAVRRLLTGEANCIALIKPQFEVGKGEVGNRGIVTDAGKHRRVLLALTAANREWGLTPFGLIESPILGAEGNREFLIHLKPSTGDKAASDLIEEQIIALTSR